MGIGKTFLTLALGASFFVSGCYPWRYNKRDIEAEHQFKKNAPEETYERAIREYDSIVGPPLPPTHEDNIWDFKPYRVFDEKVGERISAVSVRDFPKELGRAVRKNKKFRKYIDKNLWLGEKEQD